MISGASNRYIKLNGHAMSVVRDVQKERNTIIIPKFLLKILRNPFGCLITLNSLVAAWFHFVLGSQSVALKVVFRGDPFIYELWWIILGIVGISGFFGFFWNIPRLKVSALFVLSAQIAVYWLATAVWYGKNGPLIAPFLPAVSVGCFLKAIAISLRRDSP